MRHFLIIANPVSGHKGAGTIIAKAQEYLKHSQINNQVVWTAADQGLKSLLENEDLSAVTDLLVIGGDGTLNEAINATKCKWPLAIIPAGTGNDFAKNIDIGKSLEEQLHTSVHGEEKRIDLGLCNGRLFLNGIGVGFDGQVVKDMLFKKTVLKGHLAYYSIVLSILSSYRERQISVRWDEQQLQDELLLLTIGNGTTFGGGFKLTPNARLDDGWLDLCVIRKLPAWKRFANIHRLSRGTHSKLQQVAMHRAQKVRIEGDESIAAHIDGEYLGCPPFTIELKQAACTIRVAAEARVP